MVELAAIVVAFVAFFWMALVERKRDEREREDFITRNLRYSQKLRRRYPLLAIGLSLRNFDEVFARLSEPAKKALKAFGSFSYHYVGRAIDIDVSSWPEDRIDALRYGVGHLHVIKERPDGT